MSPSAGAHRVVPERWQTSALPQPPAQTPGDGSELGISCSVSCRVVGSQITPWLDGPPYSQCHWGLWGVAGGWNCHCDAEVAHDVARGGILSNSPSHCGFLRGRAFASHGDVPGALVWHVCLLLPGQCQWLLAGGPGEYS